ncbi:MAG TPA: hypothetical protein VHZ03_32630, partial [Trebonia sp.]|nr:hypothetical protein [Trebonia sp.]
RGGPLPVPGGPLSGDAPSLPGQAPSVHMRAHPPRRNQDVRGRQPRRGWVAGRARRPARGSLARGWLSAFSPVLTRT